MYSWLNYWLVCLCGLYYIAVISKDVSHSVSVIRERVVDLSKKGNSLAWSGDCYIQGFKQHHQGSSLCFLSGSLQASYSQLQGSMKRAYFFFLCSSIGSAGAMSLACLGFFFIRNNTVARGWLWLVWELSHLARLGDSPWKIRQLCYKWGNIRWYTETDVHL